MFADLRGFAFGCANNEPSSAIYAAAMRSPRRCSRIHTVLDQTLAA